MSEERDQNLPRVLIIDDSRMVRASIIRHVRGRFEVREEADGEAGWQTLLVDPTIQAVITDIGMPRLDGYGLLERMRASRLSRINTLPVVVISGDDEPEVRIKAKSAGATDFISKSVSHVELLARLDALTQLIEAYVSSKSSPLTDALALLRGRGSTWGRHETMEASITEDLGADSLDVVDLVMSIEESFDVEIPDEEVENIKTVGDIVKYIENKVEE